MMKPVRIVTDSTAEIPSELARDLGIEVVPLYLRFDGETHRDDGSVDRDEFYNQLVRGRAVPTTASPTVEDFHRVYERVGSNTKGILSIHIASGLSQTTAMAEQAASRFLGAVRIVVVDSMQASWGLGILAVEAAKKAAAGADLDEVVRFVRGLISKIYVVLYVSSFDYLRRGGRIGRARSLTNSLLATRPVLVLEDGEITPLEMTRSRGRTLDRLVEFVAEFPSIRHISVMQGKSTPEAQELLMRLNEVFPEEDIDLRHYGPVMASHIGPDAVGVVIFEGA